MRFENPIVEGTLDSSEDRRAKGRLCIVDSHCKLLAAFFLVLLCLFSGCAHAGVAHTRALWKYDVTFQNSPLLSSCYVSLSVENIHKYLDLNHF